MRASSSRSRRQSHSNRQGGNDCSASHGHDARGDHTAGASERDDPQKQRRKIETGVRLQHDGGARRKAEYERCRKRPALRDVHGSIGGYRHARGDERLADTALEKSAISVQPRRHRQHGVQRGRQRRGQWRAQAARNQEQQQASGRRGKNVEPHDRSRSRSQKAKACFVDPVDARRPLFPDVAVQPLAVRHAVCCRCPEALIDTKRFCDRHDACAERADGERCEEEQHGELRAPRRWL